MKVKDLASKIKDFYKNLSLNSFNEPEEDVSVKILSLYHKINDEETIDNLKAIIRFASYYPDLKSVDKKDHYKVISKQVMFSKVAKALLVKLRHQNKFHLEENFTQLKGEEIYEGRCENNVLFTEELKLVLVEKIYGKKTDSRKTLLCKEFDENGSLSSEINEINFNDKDQFIYIGAFQK